jgi:hypothetical protein
VDHTAQVIALIGTLIGAVLAPLAAALAMYVRAVARNLGDNNRGQNAALQRMEDAMRKSGLPVEEPPPAPRRAKRESRFYPRSVTPLPFAPIQLPTDKGDD